MVRVIKVSGESLSPLLEEGDFVLVLKIPFRFLRKGDIFVFQHPFYGTMIKLVAEKFPEKGFVHAIGVHPLSTDSQKIGPVMKDDIIGKVFLRIPRKG
jgi:signal peptidase I